MGLSFKIAAGPRHCSHSQVRVPRDSWPHFTVSDSRLLPTRRARSPQEQGGPVIPPGIGFHFRRLLRLSGLRWRYSTSPPHGIHIYFSLSTVGWRLVLIKTTRHGPRRKHRFPLLLYPFFSVETCLFAELLRSNGCCIFAYFAVVAWRRVYVSQYYIYKLSVV
jgi:hypothetical protein